MKIVLGTDFSTHAIPAAELALGLARRLGDEIVLAHAFAPSIEVLTASPEVVTHLRRRTQSELAAAAAELRAQGVAVEDRILEGFAPDALVGLAREVGARLIVVGTHGRTAASRLLFGSIAERTVLLADRPVLVVRSTPQVDLDEWVSDRRSLRLAVGIDVSPASQAAVAWVRGLRAALPCDVTFLHTYRPAREYGRIGSIGPHGPMEADPLVVDVLERELAPLVSNLPGEGRTALRVAPSWEPTGERLASDARRLGADLLVVGTHQRRGLRRLTLGSTVHPTVRASEVPVLCVPSLAAEEASLPEIRSVLCATDLSDLSRRALPHAYALVRPARGIVHICHVHEGAEGERGLSKEREGEIRSALESLAPPEARAEGVTTHVSVIEAAHADEALCQLALRLAVDAICIASHGRTGLPKALLGSVTQGVLARSERPVFVIRPQPESR